MSYFDFFHRIIDIFINVYYGIILGLPVSARLFFDFINKQISHYINIEKWFCWFFYQPRRNVDIMLMVENNLENFKKITISQHNFTTFKIAHLTIGINFSIWKPMWHCMNKSRNNLRRILGTDGKFICPSCLRKGFDITKFQLSSSRLLNLSKFKKALGHGIFHIEIILCRAWI